jgi:hypothetical protein
MMESKGISERRCAGVWVVLGMVVMVVRCVYLNQ